MPELAVPAGKRLSVGKPLSEAAISAFVRNGVTTVFGVGGTHTLPLLGAIERSGEIRFIAARTEQGAGFMAAGYARATGRPAIVLTSTGPGALNVFSALQDAWWASLPIIHLTTYVDGPGFGGGVHETPHQKSLLKLISKRSFRVEGSEIEKAIDAAVAASIRIPMGPVSIEIKAGNWGLATPDGRSVRHQVSPKSNSGDAAALSQVRQHLDRARRPVFFVGGGGVRWDSAGTVLKLAERVGAPIITSYQGKFIANWDHPLYVGPWAGEALVKDLCAQSDLALVVGSKLSAVGTDFWRLKLPEATYWLDCSPGPHPRYPHLHAIRTDALQACAQLLKESTPRPSWALDRVAEIKLSVLAAARERASLEMKYIDALAQAALPTDRFVMDMTKAGFWAIKYLPAQPQSIHAISSYLTMGSALPMGIGMCVADGRPVTVLLGDGGLQMSIAELATVGEAPTTNLAARSGRQRLWASP